MKQKQGQGRDGMIGGGSDALWSLDSRLGRLSRLTLQAQRCGECYIQLKEDYVET